VDKKIPFQSINAFIAERLIVDLLGVAHCDLAVLKCVFVWSSDLLQNPLLVPLKQLPSGEPRDQLVTLDLRFHPTQPWLLAACADHTIRLYS
jgi:hypothetical protein